MYLNQVEAFVNVAKTKSFSQAGRNMYISQPSISAHIKALEAELNVQLFIRSTKDVVLSEAGELFYQYAMRLLQDRDDAKAAMQLYNKKLDGIIRLAATEIPIQYIFPKILSSLLKRYPSLRICAYEMTHADILKSLRNADAELGLSSLPAPENGYSSVPIAEDNFVLITPNNALFRHFDGVFPQSKLPEYPFILECPKSSSRKAIDIYMRSTTQPTPALKIIAELPSALSVKQAVSCGCGLSIISHLAAADFVSDGKLLEFPLNSEYFHQQFYLIHSKNRLLSPLSNCVSTLLQQKLPSLS